MERALPHAAGYSDVASSGMPENIPPGALRAVPSPFWYSIIQLSISATTAAMADAEGSRSPESQYFAARSVTLARKASSAAVLRGHSARATLANLRLFGEQLFPAVPDRTVAAATDAVNDSRMYAPQPQQQPQRTAARPAGAPRRVQRKGRARPFQRGLEAT